MTQPLAKLKMVGGSANPDLARRVAADLKCPQVSRTIERFPDGELHVQLDESIRGDDVYVLQSIGPPVNDSLVELLLLGDAARRAGAERITAVVPYLAYARQERRKHGREAVASRLMADLVGASGLGRVVTIDVHNQAIEGFFGIPFDALTATGLLADAAKSEIPPNAVVVAPDLGAVKLADRYARLLDLPVVVVHKARISGEEVVVNMVTGHVGGRAPVIVDDMISTGGTVRAAARALMDAGCVPEIRVIATHGPLAPALTEQRLLELPLVGLWTTDTLAPPSGLKLTMQVVTVAPLIARAIAALHTNQSLAELVARQ
jgi:ribose-phosphate pyrophosphokinase